MSAVLLMIPVIWDVTACLLVNNCRYLKTLALPNFEVLQPDKLLFSTLLDRENSSNTLLRYVATYQSTRRNAPQDFHVFQCYSIFEGLDTVRCGIDGRHHFCKTPHLCCNFFLV